MIRTAPDAWYVVTGSAFGAHDMGWIRSHSPDRRHRSQVRDVTSARGVINLCGPLARDVLQAVCEDDVVQRRLPVRDRAREITIGAAPVLALRIGYVGELGWELHIPTEYAAHVYERAVGGRRAARHRRRRLPGDRHAAHGEGLPLLVDRRHARHHAAGRPASAGGSTCDEGRLLRARRARRAARRRRRRAGCARSRSRTMALPGRWRGDPRRRRRRRLHDERQLRPHDRQADRLRLPPGRARRRPRPDFDDRGLRRADPARRATTARCTTPSEREAARRERPRPTRLGAGLAGCRGRRPSRPTAHAAGRADQPQLPRRGRRRPLRACASPAPAPASTSTAPPRRSPPGRPPTPASTPRSCSSTPTDGLMVTRFVDGAATMDAERVRATSAPSTAPAARCAGCTPPRRRSPPTSGCSR